MRNLVVLAILVTGCGGTPLEKPAGNEPASISQLLTDCEREEAGIDLGVEGGTCDEARAARAADADTLFLPQSN